MKKIFRFVSEATFIGFIALSIATAIILKLERASVTKFTKDAFNYGRHYLDQ